MSQLRTEVKRALARTVPSRPAEGFAALIYHRIGGPGRDELDVSTRDFVAQMDFLAAHDVSSLGGSLRACEGGDRSPRVVLTFDDGFEEVYCNAWPVLRERRMPFTVYLCSAYVDRTMRWEGSTAVDSTGRGLTWGQLDEMVSSELCTVGNHTHNHVRPEVLDEAELDMCNQLVEQRLGVVPQHFAYPWGTSVNRMEPALRARFASAATGELGRNVPGTDPMFLRRVPVRRTDPLEFFRAKVTGDLAAERIYGRVVSAAKRVGVHA